MNTFKLGIHLRPCGITLRRVAYARSLCTSYTLLFKLCIAYYKLLTVKCNATRTYYVIVNIWVCVVPVISQRSTANPFIKRKQTRFTWHHVSLRAPFISPRYFRTESRNARTVNRGCWRAMAKTRQALWTVRSRRFDYNGVRNGARGSDIKRCLGRLNRRFAVFLRAGE